MITTCTRHPPSVDETIPRSEHPRIAHATARPASGRYDAPVTRSLSVFKRLLVGEPFTSERQRALELSKRYAIPLLAVNPISSIAYAPEQVFLVMALAGTAAYAFSAWTGLAVAVVMLTVIASYRYTVQAYPGGGGDYRVVTANLGQRAGILTAAALLLDYVLTVAVSAAAAVSSLAVVLPGLREWREAACVVAIAVLAAFNLRGGRVAGKFAAAIALAFVVGIAAVVVVGLVRIAAGRSSTRHRPSSPRSARPPSGRVRRCSCCAPAPSPRDRWP
ncbi:hypothetical protein GCM10029992_30920 [Glycomyces albus]